MSAAANRRLTEQEKIVSRLQRYGWVRTPSLSGELLRRESWRLIVIHTDFSVLRSINDVPEGTEPQKVEWKVTFSADTPFQVVIAACRAATGEKL